MEQSNLQVTGLTEALLGRVAKGDRTALASLFERHAGKLLAVARRIVRTPELAEEVVQDTFVAVWQRASQFDIARGSGEAWLVTIARNRALNMLRDRARLELHGDEAMAELGERENVAIAAFDALAEGEALRNCLAQLEPQRRKAVLLAYVVGMNHSEVASALATPLGTVKAWIRRSTIALQECLQ